MFDIFYIDNKPDNLPFAKPANSVEHACNQCRTRYFWITDYLCDYSEWDFLWEPTPWEAEFRHAFASQHQKDSCTYLIPKTGYTETKYNQNMTIKRLPSLDNWKNTTSVFDYSWHPDPADPPYVYQFGTQHQRTGGPRYCVPGADQIKYVTTLTGVVDAVASGIIIIEQAGKAKDLQFNPGLPVLGKTRYISSYLSTLKRVLPKYKEHEFVWIVSDLCDYKDFDFSWHPETWQNAMLHVFASNDQKFGDTFYIHVPTFLEKTQNLEILEWYETLNFVPDVSVKRNNPPAVKYTQDTLVDTVWEYSFSDPVVLFYQNMIPETIPTINLWQEKTKTLMPLCKGNSLALVPRETKNHLKTQLYDYPYIETSARTLPGKPMDIVYISYDEPEAEQNYATLLELTKDLDNRVVRVHGVKGMENALKAAAETSITPWCYNVFAKTELEPDFKFDYVPDYMQIPKHYIFYCRNASNGLEYGHMGVIMYNTNMVVNAPPYDELGLDYTVSFPVEVVPKLSCHGNFATSPYHAWRTAFRESAKLSYFNVETPDIEIQYRLNVWTTHAVGEYSEWVLHGANDGVEFFKESNGRLEYLKQSFRWEWLRERFVKKYGDLA